MIKKNKRIVDDRWERATRKRTLIGKIVWHADSQENEINENRTVAN